MAEYIERDQILGYLDLVVIHARGVAGNDSILKKVTGIVENMRDLVAEAPAADVVPVLHGRWVDGECGTFCTNCNRVFDEEFEIRRDVCKKLLRCPNCGARMKDGE